MLILLYLSISILTGASQYIIGSSGGSGAWQISTLPVSNELSIDLSDSCTGSTFRAFSDQLVNVISGENVCPPVVIYKASISNIANLTLSNCASGIDYTIINATSGGYDIRSLHLKKYNTIVTPTSTKLGEYITIPHGSKVSCFCVSSANTGVLGELYCH